MGILEPANASFLYAQHGMYSMNLHIKIVCIVSNCLFPGCAGCENKPPSGQYKSKSLNHTL